MVYWRVTARAIIFCIQCGRYYIGDMTLETMRFKQGHDRNLKRLYDANVNRRLCAANYFLVAYKANDFLQSHFLRQQLICHVRALRSSKYGQEIAKI